MTLAYISLIITSLILFHFHFYKKPIAKLCGKAVPKAPEYFGGLWWGLALLIVFIVTRSWVVDYAVVPTGSMVPTININDRILIDKWTYSGCREQECLPQNGDIIVFKNPFDPDIPYVKRVIGSAGDRVEIKGSSVYLNGKELKEDYLNQTDFEYMKAIDVKVKDNEWFVMGDNRGKSIDSRVYGTILKSDLIGKVIQ